ncbi:MAG TPA: CAP domain-containing protein [Micromonosporaceae bacterium]|nr:CAP domain-containing protein [Micromonosporaceae bacterium]
MRRTSTRAGRHRYLRRARGPLLRATSIGGLLILFSVGAVLLPPNLSNAPDTAAPGGTTGSTTEHPASTVTPAPPSATADPSPSATGPTSAPPVSRASRRTPSPRPHRASGAPTITTEAQQVLTLVNRERVANGCRAVTINERLTTAAQRHSQDQAATNTMSHTGSDGSSPWERAERAGYKNAISENVAYGYRTPEAVMTGWMNSPGHRANILDCRARAMGLGVASARNGTRYWTQMFGSVA